MHQDDYLFLITNYSTQTFLAIAYSLFPSVAAAFICLCLGLALKAMLSLEKSTLGYMAEV